MFDKNLIDLSVMSTEQIDKIIRKAKKIMQSPADYRHACDGKILATLFYEPSTRTQMSFQTAMLKLGGRTIGFDNPMNSSVSKGESLKDTITIVGEYADIIAIRHPVEGTVHSLIKTLAKYPNNSFVLISTKELSVPLYVIDILEKNGCKYEISHSLADAITDLDVLYMTRIQRERFASEEDYQAQKNVFVLDKEKLDKAKENMIILHPLPRVNEITVDIDDDPRALYFKQAQYGMYGRMALILLLLQDDEFFVENRPFVVSNHHCNNPKCITQQEPYLPNLSYEKLGMVMCGYCDKRID